MGMASPSFAPLSLCSSSERCLQIQNSNNDGVRQQQRAAWLLIGSLLPSARQLSQLLLSTFATVSGFSKSKHWCGTDMNVQGIWGARFLGLTLEGEEFPHLLLQALNETAQVIAVCITMETKPVAVIQVQLPSASAKGSLNMKPYSRVSVAWKTGQSQTIQLDATHSYFTWSPCPL